MSQNPSCVVNTQLFLISFVQGCFFIENKLRRFHDLETGSKMTLQGCHSHRKVREKQKFFKVRGKVREFCKRSEKILEVCKSQWKVRELYFLSEKHHEKWPIWVMFAGIVVLISGFLVFFIIHLANLRSGKIVQKSVKSEGKDREFFSFWWVATLHC